jgi:hypothetical protein
MINAVECGINNIKNMIPNFILDLAFENEEDLDIEYSIHKNVIENMVLLNCNMVGGKTIQIDLKKEWYEPVKDEAMCTVYRIPSEFRDNKKIIEVHRVQYTPRNRPAYFAYSGAVQSAAMFRHDPRVHLSAVEKAQQVMLSSKSGIGGSMATPHPEVLHGDLIKLHPSPRIHIPWVLTCRIEYDNEMTNLNSEAVEKFAKLCVTATKIYCYNNLIEKVDIGFIKHGVEIPAVKEQINKWEGLESVYDEQVTAFSKAASLDMQRLGHLIQYMV